MARYRERRPTFPQLTSKVGTALRSCPKTAAGQVGTALRSCPKTVAGQVGTALPASSANYAGTSRKRPYTYINAARPEVVALPDTDPDSDPDSA
jgi:hypothetical protein